MAEQATQVEGAEPPPPGQSADIDHPQDALYSISLAIAVLTLILPIPFLLVRVYSPFKLRSPLKLDDWSCVAAFLFGIAYLASGIVFAEHGGGHHVWEVTDFQLQRILETTYWSSIIYSPAAFLIKITLLLIAVRVFKGNTLFVYLGYCLMTVMVGYYVPVTVLKIMTCRPIRGYWDYGEDSSCYDYRLVFLSDAIGASTTDILVLLVTLPLLWTSSGLRVKMWPILGAGSIATAMSLVRMVLVVCLQETKDPTLDFVRLSLFSQTEIAMGLICTCLPPINEYFQSRKSLQSNSQRPRPSMGHRTRKFLNPSTFRPQRLSTPERAVLTVSHPGIRVERDIMITGPYSPEASLRPLSGCLQPSTIVSHATPPTSMESRTLSTTTVHQANETAPPIPAKSSARLSIHRKSWGPATTLSSYIGSTTLPTETGAITENNQIPRYKFPLYEEKQLPYLPPPLFSGVQRTPPIPEVITPASSKSSAQRSPSFLKLSPRWNGWPRSHTAGPSPPDSPLEDLLQRFKPPKMWQGRYSDHRNRPYSV